MKPCPCGSFRPFMQCCRSFITGKKLPETAEQLMRSRYSAYTRADIDYIEKTMCKAALEGFNATEAKQWAQSVKWQKLTVLKTEQGGPNDTTGTVHFKAYFKENGQLQMLDEKSQFEKIKGQWFYIGMVSS